MRVLIESSAALLALHRCGGRIERAGSSHATSGLLPRFPPRGRLYVSPEYIQAAKRKYGDRARFFCDRVKVDTVRGEQFDLVIPSGILHHLNDAEAIDLFGLAYSVLRTGSRLVTLDVGYEERQSPVARYLLSRDRGHYVRSCPAYETRARSVFNNVVSHVGRDLLGAIPYTHVIFQCTK